MWLAESFIKIHHKLGSLPWLLYNTVVSPFYFYFSFFMCFLFQCFNSIIIEDKNENVIVNKVAPPLQTWDFSSAESNLAMDDDEFAFGWGKIRPKCLKFLNCPVGFAFVFGVYNMFLGSYSRGISKWKSLYDEINGIKWCMVFLIRYSSVGSSRSCFTQYWAKVFLLIKRTWSDFRFQWCNSGVICCVYQLLWWLWQ